MAENFKIRIFKKSGNIHLMLYGDFDGNSAHELINTINELCNYTMLFIHTGYLKTVNTFGIDVFRKNLNMINVRPYSCWFTGDKAVELIPKQNNYFFIAYS